MLPKIDVPLFNLTLPLSKKTIKFRPFLVKEEKILLMAMESGEEDSILAAIKQIINNCCVDELNVDILPVTDLEFLFLNLRARSIGETIELQYKCNNKVVSDSGEEKDCGGVVKFDLNLLTVKPESDPDHTNKIQLTEKMGIVMKYPNMKIVESSDGENATERIMKVLMNCVDYIYDAETVYYRKDIEDKELVEFLENLNRDQFAKIQNFFDTMPKVKTHLDFKCIKCGYEEKVLVEGIQNFFV
jgi:hypothetical protein